MRIFWLSLVVAATGLAQEHITVPLADPGRPVTLEVRLLRGAITVHGYGGREVIVDSRDGGTTQPETTRDGLHRIGGGRGDVSIESENNRVTVSSHGGRGGGVSIQTPMNTSLKLKSIGGGEITVDGVNGEIEAQALNGAVTLRNVSGSVIAHSLNGAVTVTMANVKSGNPMSFTSLNGTIDVTLPANVAADFAMKTTRGEIYSDFDVRLKASPKPIVEESGSNKGKYKVKTDGAVIGAVNGGGPEFKFQTLNGNIYIRKAK